MTSFMLAIVSSTIIALNGCSQCLICIASQPVLVFSSNNRSVFSCDVTSILVSIFVLIFFFESSSSIVSISGCLSSHERLPEK